ncbi:hypothetical protein [Microbaculum marinum]|uniref:Lipoprotein n=1 Tax=Microbaculum marinum TaxID=1764581 RepID=A0AAW9RG31_9HYPH
MQVRRWIGIAAAIGIAGLASVAVTGSGRAEPDTSAAGKAVSTYNRWEWFKDTYWIVPQRGIYSVAHLLDDNTFGVIKGQTVFHITDYFNGYWTGAVVVKITRALVPSCQFVLGQVTPEGRVFMTMYDADDGSVVNYPIGTMVRKRGEWTMVNEMTNVTQGGDTLSHWAYMVQAKPGDRRWNNLPFARQSVPEFMSSCPEGPQINLRGGLGDHPIFGRP